MIRAIYIGDVRYNQINVFEYNPKTKEFHMINDKSFSYPFECVMEGKNWLVYFIDGEKVYSMEIKNKTLILNLKVN